MRVAGRAHPVWSGRSVVYAADDGLCVRCVHGVSYAGTSHGSGVQRWDWSVANRISADICDPERNTGKSTTETSKKSRRKRRPLLGPEEPVALETADAFALEPQPQTATKIGDIDIAMSSYFANSYLPDMRPAAGVGNGDHYGPPHQQQQPNGDHCDQRQYLPYGGSPGHQGYPRFPPYDRLEIRAISSAPDSPSPPSGYYGNHCGAPPAPPPPTPVQQQQPPQAMTHPNAYVPAPVEAPNCRGSPSEAPVPPAMAQYPSCKMQTGHLAGDVHGVTGRGGGDCGSAAVMHGGACGSPPGVHSPPLQQQQQQLYSPGHGGMPPNGQQPPTHNSGAMPSPLYPWMRSQFGEYHRLVCSVS
ncbi:hypothetical protein HPB47_009369 [Ixodes persulcatus]|uniref:Uncharacterized protein n=1 Tax=Ixodes persulcatus TaxID=34615 RepID=A0AC60P2E6_IXOPE|nr:hypothetical protein HPB47_009369 [Ixodes persulcatus]